MPGRTIVNLFLNRTDLDNDTISTLADCAFLDLHKLDPEQLDTVVTNTATHRSAHLQFVQRAETHVPLLRCAALSTNAIDHIVTTIDVGSPATQSTHDAAVTVLVAQHPNTAVSTLARLETRSITQTAGPQHQDLSPSAVRALFALAPGWNGTVVELINAADSVTAPHHTP